MGLFRRSPAQNRARQAQGLPPGPLRTFLETPVADPPTPADKVPMLAVDVETTGLDPNHDRLLSIGWVPVDGLAIPLSGARHLVVASDAEVGQSATIHGITDDALRTGTPLKECVDAFLSACTGRVLVAHHAQIETNYLGRACEQVYGVRPSFTTVDTMQIQYRLLTKGFDDEPPKGALRLWSARDQYGLPRYSAHNALVDALACGELLLAQVGALGPNPTLKQLVG